MRKYRYLRNLVLLVILIVQACGKDDSPNPDSNPTNGTPIIKAQTFNVLEDMGPGVIDNVLASDPDDDAITFSITTNSSDLFNISENGELSLASGKALDYETETSHQLIVEVTDGENSANATITINVDNVRDEPFVTTWEVGAGDTLVIPTGGDYTYSCTIDWGDGTVETITSNTPEHTYDADGNYTVSIGVGFPSIEMKDSSSSRDKLTSIEQWGEIEWEKLENAFYFCQNMVVKATDAPDLSKVTSLEAMFYGAISFTGNLNNWDVSNVTNMAEMFQFAILFNSDLNNWDVSKVTDMSYMFNEAESFNGDISNWTVTSVENMRGMFTTAQAFNQNLNLWKVEKVTNMAFMFSSATIFNGDISDWEVSAVTDMQDMFSYANSFAQDLSSWKVGEVTNMNAMFTYATSFNSDLSGWDVQKVTDMSVMFSDATSFNANLSSWEVDAVTDMWGMFRNAESFDHNLGDWNIENVVDMAQMLNESGLSIENYDNTLIGWAD
ncbi:BspA family leucine-rich repeat surface protein [Flagellimonas sp. SN16]|uniref:BspA family leucine-rich repeat surface protein n=1 Tax=Flagellimonas sp. SN16 TaxID=3415142 RepID=UPI003C575F31